MDYLRQGIHLRGYAQKNPKQEYKREAFEMFGSLLERFKHEVISILTKGSIRPELQMPDEGLDEQAMEFQHADASAMADAQEAAQAPAAAAPGADEGAGAAPFVRPGRKIGRNEPCPCGSGKKFKQCHGRLR